MVPWIEYYYYYHYYDDDAILSYRFRTDMFFSLEARDQSLDICVRLDNLIIQIDTKFPMENIIQDWMSNFLSTISIESVFLICPLIWLSIGFFLYIEYLVHIQEGSNSDMLLLFKSSLTTNVKDN